MEKRRTKGVIVLSIILLMGITLVSAEGVSVSDEGVEYDSELTWQFLVSDWVPVTIKIKDTSNISIPHRTSPDFESKVNERTIILSEISESILSTLSNDEFQLEGKFPIGNGFYGNITKEGFDKLLKDDRIRKIYAEKEISIQSGTIVKNLFIYIVPILIVIIVFIILFIKLKKRRWKKEELKE